MRQGRPARLQQDLDHPRREHGRLRAGGRAGGVVRRFPRGEQSRATADVRLGPLGQGNHTRGRGPGARGPGRSGEPCGGERWGKDGGCGAGGAHVHEERERGELLRTPNVVLVPLFDELEDACGAPPGQALSGGPGRAAPRAERVAGGGSGRTYVGQDDVSVEAVDSIVYVRSGRLVPGRLRALICGSEADATPGRRLVCETRRWENVNSRKTGC